MEQTRLELFHTLQKPQVREVTREDGGKDLEFEGYAIVFNEPSVVMCDWWEDKVFREIILPEAISQEMLDTTDIICTAFHNREKLLARHHADGSGTMTLDKDEVGVKCRFTFADSPTAQDIASSVKRGDMPGMSFSFYETDYTYTDKKGEDGIFERTINHFDSIFEVTVASSPAYPATTAKCREAWDAEKHGAEREAQRQMAEKAKLTRERALRDIQRDIELTELENF